jgi:chromosome segregation ATPase
MSVQRFNSGKKLTLGSYTSENPEISRKTPQRFSDPTFSFPQSPRFPLHFIGELQDQLRSCQTALIEMTKQKKSIDSENKDLKFQLKEKDEELARLCEENFKLRADLRDNEYNLSDYWKKEVLRKNEGIKKYQENIRIQEKEQRLKLEQELKKLLELFEADQKTQQLKSDLHEKQLQTLSTKIKDLESENSFLRATHSKISEIDYEKQLEELEVMQKAMLDENTTLKQELEIIRRGNNFQDSVVLSADIHKISRQVHSLLTILKNLKSGSEISLYLLLDMDEGRVISSSRQLVIDVAQLKKDLTEIKEIVSDYHAEIVGGNICSPQ